MASWTISPRLLGCFRIEIWNHWPIWIFPRKCSTKPLLASNQGRGWVTYIPPDSCSHDLSLGGPLESPHPALHPGDQPSSAMVSAAAWVWWLLRGLHSIGLSPNPQPRPVFCLHPTPDLWALPHSGSSRTRYSLVSPSFPTSLMLLNFSKPLLSFAKWGESSSSSYSGDGEKTSCKWKSFTDCECAPAPGPHPVSAHDCWNSAECLTLNWALCIIIS